MVGHRCNKCKKKFVSEYLLNKHLNRAVPCDTKLQCDICGREFSLKKDFEQHMNRKTPCIKINENVKFYKEIELQIEQEKIKQEEEITRRELEKIRLKSELEIKKIQKESELRHIEIELRRQKNLEIEAVKEKRKQNNNNNNLPLPYSNKIQYCYVISNDLNIAHNRFKFGRTTCNQKDLVGCYSRGLPNAQVLLYYETDDYIRDENHVLDHFKEYRISHGNGNRKSEWLQIEFERLKDFLDIYFENNIEENPIESEDS